MERRKGRSAPPLGPPRGESRHMKTRTLSLAVALGCALTGLIAPVAHATPPITTTMTLTSNPAQLTVGEQVTCTATLSHPLNAGSITFSTGGSGISSCQTITPVDGVATCTVTAGSTAGHQMYGATYTPAMG